MANFTAIIFTKSEPPVVTSKVRGFSSYNLEANWICCKEIVVQDEVLYSTTKRKTGMSRQPSHFELCSYPTKQTQKIDF